MNAALPLRVHRSQVTTALAILGIPPEHLISVQMDHRSLWVEEMRLDAAGRPFPAGSEIAMIARSIAVVADPIPDPAVRRATARGRIRAVRHRRPRR